VKQAYLSTINSLERMHRQFLEVIKNELDRTDVRDINNVQALILYNIGGDELTVGELTLRGYYLGSNVSYNLKKLVEMGYIHHQRSRMDRRSVRVKLTDKGQNVRQIINELFQKHAEGMLGKDVVGKEAIENINMSLRKVERYWTDQIRYIY